MSAEQLGDLDGLIKRLQGHDAAFVNNMIDILFKMIIVGSGNEFIHFLLEIVDQGEHIEFQHGTYDLNEALASFDGTVNTEEKLKVLSIIGNDGFEYTAYDYFYYDPSNVVMITSLVRLLIDNRYYVRIYDPDSDRGEMEQQEMMDSMLDPEDILPSFDPDAMYSIED